MKIFSSAQIKKWDEATIREQDIRSNQLMERAATGCFQWIKEHFSREHGAVILCGRGGNGGDGLVIARLLCRVHYSVTVILSGDPQHLQGDTRLQYETLINWKGEGPLDSMKIMQLSDFSAASMAPDDFIVDALFGTGLNRPLKADSDIGRRILLINSLPNPKVAIDLPSGLRTDTVPAAEDVVLKTDRCLSFQAYKRSFLHPEAARFAGHIKVLDIGLSPSFRKVADTSFYTLDKAVVGSLYRPRDPFGHKGSFGTAVLVGGSYGKIGAIGLSSMAALRAGAGKVFIQAPKCGYEILQQLVPEAMFQPAGESYVEQIAEMDKAVFGIGPGFDKHPESHDALFQFLCGHHRPAVLDADALNIIAENKQQLFPLLSPNTIITPHPKEFQRLFGGAANSLEQVDQAIQAAQSHQLIIVLKGHRTAVCLPDGRCFYNLTGNAGMGTAGSGDVLTGVVTGLLAQGYLSSEAALLGVYLHGLAGDLAVKSSAEEALIAGDIAAHLGAAFKTLAKAAKKK